MIERGNVFEYRGVQFICWGGSIQPMYDDSHFSIGDAEQMSVGQQVIAILYAAEIYFKQSLNHNSLLP